MLIERSKYDGRRLLVPCSHEIYLKNENEDVEINMNSGIYNKLI